MNQFPFVENSSDTRKAFIANWREKETLRRMEDDAAGGVSFLHEMDARKCKGEMRDLVKKANEDQLKKIVAEIRATPPVASPRLLKIMGLDPFHRARWGQGDRSPVDDTAPFIDDTLPI